MNTQMNSISEISMERTVCAGDCPVYTVTFKRNGAALYEGKDNVKKIGPYSGDIDERDFERLEQTLVKLGFEGLEESYSNSVRENANVIISSRRGNNVKRVITTMDSGPVELWAIEKVIEALIEDIYWEQV